MPWGSYSFFLANLLPFFLWISLLIWFFQTLTCCIHLWLLGVIIQTVGPHNNGWLPTFMVPVSLCRIGWCYWACTFPCGWFHLLTLLHSLLISTVPQSYTKCDWSWLYMYLSSQYCFHKILLLHLHHTPINSTATSLSLLDDPSWMTIEIEFHQHGAIVAISASS